MSDDNPLAKLPMINDPHAPELLVDDVAGVNYLGGTLRVVLESWRWDYSGSEPSVERVVNARLVLSPYSALRLVNMISQFAQSAHQTVEETEPLPGEQKPAPETIN